MNGYRSCLMARAPVAAMTPEQHLQEEECAKVALQIRMMFPGSDGQSTGCFRMQSIYPTTPSHESKEKQIWMR